MNCSCSSTDSCICNQLASIAMLSKISWVNKKWRNLILPWSVLSGKFFLCWCGAQDFCSKNIFICRFEHWFKASSSPCELMLKDLACLLLDNELQQVGEHQLIRAFWTRQLQYLAGMCVQKPGLQLLPLQVFLIAVFQNLIPHLMDVKTWYFLDRLCIPKSCVKGWSWLAV